MSVTTTAFILLAAAAVAWWGLNLRLSRRLSQLEFLMLLLSVAATLAVVFQSGLFLILKPLPIILAIVFVFNRARSEGGVRLFDALLLFALAFSLTGDILLELPGDFFVPGLAAFLVAHLFFVFLFKQGQKWFPDKKALAAVICAGALMYATVWGGLADPVLKIAVAAYVTVISLMTSQALGRASVLGKADARLAAIGCCVFMCSDSLIAINKFVMPIAMDSLLVMSTYYLAQMLIVHNSHDQLPRAAAV